MRYQGRITAWKDDKGFGFITPNGGGDPVFLHISAFEGRQPRPCGNEFVTYEVERDAKGRLQARRVAYLDAPRQRGGQEARRGRSPGPRRPWASIAVAAVVVAAAGWTVYTRTAHRIAGGVPEASLDTAPSAAPADGTRFRCEGKIYCSQMSSCEEAKFYLRNCPGVKIDGDGDGIPCERRHC